MKRKNLKHNKKLKGDNMNNRTKFKFILENIIREILIENQGNIFEPTKDGFEDFCNYLNTNIKAPMVNAIGSSLGGVKEVYLTVALDEKSKWPNNIFQNSRYFRMTIHYAGTIENFSRNLHQKSTNKYMAYDDIPIKFRKTKAKNAADVVNKIQKFINDILNYYNTMDITLKPNYLK